MCRLQVRQVRVNRTFSFEGLVLVHRPKATSIGTCAATVHAATLSMQRWKCRMLRVRRPESSNGRFSQSENPWISNSAEEVVEAPHFNGCYSLIRNLFDFRVRYTIVSCCDKSLSTI